MRSGTKGHKKEVVEERVLHDINTFFRTSFRDERLKHVSITKVEITRDYSLAKVYWDTYDPNLIDEAKKALEGTSKKVRSMLSQSLNVRHTPQINFIYDSQFEDETNISKILGEEKKLGKYSESDVDDPENKDK